MISSFFSKSKPIHLVVISSLLLVVFLIAKTYSIKEPLTVLLFFKEAGLFLVCLLSLFVLDFFVSKNNLTKKNSYKILLFGLCFMVLPEALLNSKILLANLFVLLALRRIVSLRTQKDIKKKLFDAAFWITVASLLYFWSALFFILIFAALILYTILDVKNWMIPFVGLLSVLIIAASYMIVMHLDFENYWNGLINFSFDFTPLNSKRIIIASTLLFSYGTWAAFYFMKNLKNKSKTSRPSAILVIISSLIALVIIAIAPNKNGSEFLFLFAPLAIIMANYLETIEEKWFREGLIYGLILVPIITLML